jgi:hypothetical protein
VTHRAWILVTIAYALLAIGMIVSLVVLSNQQDNIEKNKNNLIIAAANLCEATYQPNDRRERIFLTRVSLVGGVAHLSSPCRRALERIKEAGK